MGGCGRPFSFRVPCYDAPMISRRQFLRGQFAARDADAPPSGDGHRIARIGTNCVAFASNVVCRSCGDACGEAAIRFSPRLGGAACPAVLAERCTACGECVTACPAGAVTLVTAPADLSET